jgi:DoxX-like family
MATVQVLPRSPMPSATRGVQIGIWVSTGIFCLMFAGSGAMFIAGPAEIVSNFRHLGYPDYFRELLGVAKLLGVAALALRLPAPTLREWAYAGFTFTCIGAAASHVMSGEPVGRAIPPLFALALLLTSYFLRRRAARA